MQQQQEPPDVRAADLLFEAAKIMASLPPEHRLWLLVYLLDALDSMNRKETEALLAELQGAIGTRLADGQWPVVR